MSSHFMGHRTFPFGRLMATPAVLEVVTQYELTDALCRHADGDRGDVCREDKAANDHALLVGSRLFSVYHTTDGTKFWIITEADRAVTTVLLRSDY